MYHVPVNGSRKGCPERSVPWITVACVGLLVAVYAPGLLGGKTLFLRDIGSHQLGWRLLWARTVGAGHLPLWDPLTLGGTALAGNPNTMALYPFTALFLLFEPPVALALFLLLHHILLGAGTWHLLRRLGFRGSSALGGAVATAGSGIAFSQAAFMAGPSTLAWIPFLLASVVAWPREPRGVRRRIAEGTLAGAMVILVGKPELIVLSWLAWFAVLAPWRRRVRWTGLASAVLAVALAAPLLLAAVPVARASWRNAAGTPEAAVSADAFTPRRWPEVVLPRLYGRPAPELPGGFWAAPSFPWQRYELDLHVGTVTLLLLGLAWRRREARPWLAGAGALVLLAAVPGITVALRRLLPPVRLFRYAIKDLLPAVVLLGPAVATGVGAALEDGARVRRRALILAAVFAPLAVLAARPEWVAAILGRLFPASAANLAMPGVAGIVAWDILFDLAVAVLPLLAVAWRPRTFLLPALAVQLLLGGIPVVRWDDWRAWETPPPAVRILGPDAVVLDHYAFEDRKPPRATDPDQVVREHYGRLRAALASHYGTLWGVAYRGLEGPDGTEPAWMHLLGARFEQAGSLEAARAARHVGAGWLLTDRPVPAGSCWSERIALPGAYPGCTAYRLTPNLPVAWFPSRIVTVPSDAALWRQLTDPGTGPGRIAVVLGPRSRVRPVRGSCRVLAARPGWWRVEVESPAGGLVVLLDAWSRQWRAHTGAGAALETVRVNGLLLGVRIPPGQHVVEAAIDARPLLAGFAIGAVALLLTVLLAAGAPIRGRRIPTGAGEPRSRASRPGR